MTDAYVKLRNEVMAGGTEGPDGGAPVSGARAVLGLGIIAALLVWLAATNIWMFVFAVGILVSIFLHELGHFSTAKLTGMKATQFFLFMGPKLWSFRRGETEYGVRAYPVGAFVRIIGMNNLDEVDPADEPRAYRTKSFPRRLLVITAGSLMHMILAVALLFGVYAVNGRRVSAERVRIASVVESGPAASQGVRPDDVVMAMDGARQTSGSQFVAAIRTHRPGDVVRLTLLGPDGTTREVAVTLAGRPDDPAAGFLGVSSGTELHWNQESVSSAAVHSVTDLGHIMWQSVGGLVTIANPVNIIHHLTDRNADPTTQPGTLVGATKFSSVIGSELGFSGVMLLLAGFNVFIGLFNMVPLLPFDGGHAAIAVYERLRSRRGRQYHADVRKLIPVSMVTLGFLVFLFMSALYLDIARPVK